MLTQISSGFFFTPEGFVITFKYSTHKPRLMDKSPSMDKYLQKKSAESRGEALSSSGAERVQRPVFHPQGTRPHQARTAGQRHHFWFQVSIKESLQQPQEADCRESKERRGVRRANKEYGDKSGLVKF